MKSLSTFVHCTITLLTVERFSAIVRLLKLSSYLPPIRPRRNYAESDALCVRGMFNVARCDFNEML